MKVTPKNRWFFHPSAWWVKGWNWWLGSDQSLMSCSFTFGRHKSSKYIQMIADTTGIYWSTGYVRFTSLFSDFCYIPTLSRVAPNAPSTFRRTKMDPITVSRFSHLGPCHRHRQCPAKRHGAVCVCVDIFGRQLVATGGLGMFSFFMLGSQWKKIGLSPNLWDMKNI